MKAIAYHISLQQKELLIVANHKKHDITVIANPLNLDTLPFAAGKEVLLILNEAILSAELIEGLQQMGIKYIVTASLATSHIDMISANVAKIKIANVPLINGSEAEYCNYLIKNLDKWAVDKCVGKACCCAGGCAAKLL
jgi:lactate dehydrogenase-like 2-hydroxyacid dehydrogenase